MLGDRRRGKGILKGMRCGWRKRRGDNDAGGNHCFYQPVEVYYVSNAVAATEVNQVQRGLVLPSVLILCVCTT